MGKSWEGTWGLVGHLDVLGLVVAAWKHTCASSAESKERFVLNLCCEAAPPVSPGVSSGLFSP